VALGVVGAGLVFAALGSLTALAMSDVPAPAAVLGLLALVAAVGLACLASSLWTLAGTAVPRWPLPRLAAERGSLTVFARFVRHSPR
jgi:hypothetical protein